MIRVRKITEIATPSTCNCLLSGYSMGDEGNFDFVSGSYELLSNSNETLSSEYRGGVSGYIYKMNEENNYFLCETFSVSLEAKPATLPGIFDLTSFNDGNHLMASCTDGTVRLLRSQEGYFKDTIFPVHNLMLTSTSPFYCSNNDIFNKTKWVCTAHQGEVMIYDVITKTIIDTLDGHEYDAWCSATIDSEIAISGGDDSMLKWWDTRNGKSSVGKMRFGAGVVSIAPISEGGFSTPYSLVGSYDENLYLVDSRLQKEPIASINLGGGVWRCSRQLLFEGISLEAKSQMASYRWVQSSNTLAIPVMQRGVAFVRYDTNTSEEKVFSLLGHLHQNEEENSTEGVCLPNNALFYDTAVLSQSSQFDKNMGDNITIVATCDFYNKNIELWEVKGIQQTE